MSKLIGVTQATEMVNYLVSVVTCFSARDLGARSGKNENNDKSNVN